MRNVRPYSDKEILDRIRSLPSFKGFPRGPMDVWIRSAKDEYDSFDDVVFTYWCDGSDDVPRFIMKSSGTTNAGSEGLMNFAKYNRRGCAVLCADVIVYNSHIYGLHKGKPAYIQSYSVGFPYTRDNNRNKKAENYGTVYTDRIGANCHRAGWLSRIIGSWSVGCLVWASEQEFLRWLNYLRVEGFPPLSVVILNEF